MLVTNSVPFEYKNFSYETIERLAKNDSVFLYAANNICEEKASRGDISVDHEWIMKNLYDINTKSKYSNLKQNLSTDPVYASALSNSRSCYSTSYSTSYSSIVDCGPIIKTYDEMKKSMDEEKLMQEYYKGDGSYKPSSAARIIRLDGAELIGDETC